VRERERERERKKVAFISTQTSLEREISQLDSAWSMFELITWGMIYGE
jgi:hypothetical protein